MSGSFSSKLKVAKVIRRYKIGSLNNPSSYRPISLLPIVSTIFKKVVYKQLLDFLESNQLLDDEQHGLVIL